MGPQAAFSAALLLLTLTANFRPAFSQCDILPQAYPFNVSDSIAASGILGTATLSTPGAVIYPGTQVVLQDKDASYISAEFTTNVITFKALPNFSNFLDVGQPPNSEEIYVPYRLTCFTATGLNVTLDRSIMLNVTDTNNKAPVAYIPNPDFRINLETWQSNDPLNFLPGQVIEFTDNDYDLVNAVVTVKSDNDVIRIQRDGLPSSRRYTYSYYLYLNPDAQPGNYSITLNATDFTHYGTGNITLYIAGGIQFQASVFTVLILVCISTWFNMK